MTYRCNLQCRYCPTFKADLDISYDVIDAALTRFLTLPNLKTIRFFGAEPLLVQDKILYTYHRVRELISDSRFQTLRFSITTNGTLLNSEFLDFLAAAPNFELVVSADGLPNWHRTFRVGIDNTDSYSWIEHWRRPLLSLRPPVGVNLTIAPQAATALIENFGHLYKLGFRKFNFLPAYYVVWSDDELEALKRSFKKLAGLIGKMWRRGMHVLVRNMFVESEETFFNPAVVVDVDGAVFTTSAVLTTRMRKFRERLRLGDVFSDKFVSPQITTQEAVQQAFGKRLVEATTQVDNLLDEFVDLLWQQRFLSEVEK